MAEGTTWKNQSLKIVSMFENLMKYEMPIIAEAYSEK